MGELIVIAYSNRRKWILEQYPPIRELNTGEISVFTVGKMGMYL